MSEWPVNSTTARTANSGGDGTRGSLATVVPLNWPAKDPADICDYPLDFAGAGAMPTDTLVSASATARQLGILNAGTLAIGAVTVAGQVATVRITGGSDPLLYLVVVAGTFTSGQVLNRAVLLPVLSQANPSIPQLVPGNPDVPVVPDGLLLAGAAGAFQPVALAPGLVMLPGPPLTLAPDPTFLVTQAQLQARTSIAAGVISAGSTQANALPMPAVTSIFGTVAPGTGAILSAANAAATCRVVNAGANDLRVYPPVGAAIAGNAVNAPVIVSANQSVDFMTQSATSLWFAS